MTRVMRSIVRSLFASAIPACGRHSGAKPGVALTPLGKPNIVLNSFAQQLPVRRH